MTDRKITIILCMITLIIGLYGCLSNMNIIENTGTIKFIGLEGGFYGIVADDGERYDPINLPTEFEIDGVRIRFKGMIRDDLVSIHMWGRMIELLYIERL